MIYLIDNIKMFIDTKKIIFGRLFLFLLLFLFLMSIFLTGCSSRPVQQQVDDEITEIVLDDNGLGVKISPTADNKIKGSIDIDIIDVPDGTNRITVILSPKVLKNSSKNIVAKFLSPDPQQFVLDTTQVEDGDYNLAITAREGVSGKGFLLAVAQTGVIVDN